MVENKYMKRALQLARIAEGSTSPNPMVGAVIVYENKIIGEGYHHRCGEAHAEVEAINSVKDKELLKRSTMYVSLEPCSHHGKTPPCVDLILSVGIPKVVVAMEDPFHKVSGRGIEILRQHNVEVEVGILEKDAKFLNRFFITNNTLSRPYVTLKWAESKDGFMDKKRDDSTERPVVFSSPIYQRVVHKERMIHDAIMIGYRTALLDNPSLTNRLWYGKSPIRIVLDDKLSLKEDLKIFNDGEKTFVVHGLGIDDRYSFSINNLHLLSVPFDNNFVDSLLSSLFEQNIKSILVEGGAKTLQRFIDAGLYDEVMIEKSSILLGCGVKSPDTTQLRLKLKELS